MKEELLKAYEDMKSSNRERDTYKLEYELEKAKLLFSSAGRNQATRDAEILTALEDRGMYRKMAELETKSREDYYWWKTLIALQEGR